MFKSRTAKLAQWLVFGLGLCQIASADTYKNLNQGIPPIIYKSIKLGHTNPNKVIHLNINLAPSNYGALEAYANAVSKPKSPMFGKFLTPEQVGARFGASLTNFTKVKDYLTAHGFKIKVAAKNRMNIMAEGPVKNIEAAFQTEIDDFQTLSKADPENQNYYSYVSRVKVPTELSGVVRSISGLQSHSKPKPMAVPALTPAQTHGLYGLTGFYPTYSGQGRNVAITSFDGFLLSNVPLFLTAFGLPSPAAGQGTNIKVITVDGGSQSSTAGGEADLDIQMVLGQAPLCNFYIYDGAINLIDVLTQESNDNIADIISESYGFNMSTDEALACHTVHLAMTAQGITYMGASGDNGTDLLGFDYPNFDPEVLKVGGTIASVDSNNARVAEVDWDGSGSGWSTRTDSFNQLPSWQTGPGVPIGNNHRLFPDVALNAAGNFTGAYQFFFAGAVTSDFSGTSFACPVFAGGLAVAQQKLAALGSLPFAPNGRARFGRVQDRIYLERGRPDVWFDVVEGNSTGALPDGTIASAGTGWDFTTGWGAINFDGFVAAEAAAPIDVAPSAVSVYTGNYLAGTKTSLINVDQLTYDVASTEFAGVGQIAGEKVTFKLPVPNSSVESVAFNTTTSCHDLATVQVFALNVVTGQYDLLQSFPGSFAFQTIKFGVNNYANYISTGGTLTFVVRSLSPDRLGTGSFTFSTDQSKLVVISTTKPQ